MEIFHYFTGLTFTAANINATTILVFVTVAISFYAESNPRFKASWILNPYTITTRKEYHRLLTSGFIHGDFIHLAFNMLVLHSFGNILEYTFRSLFGDFGMILYVILYITAIVASSIPSLIKHQANPGYNALGASGGVSAIVFAQILFYPTQGIGFLFVPGISFPGFVIGILYLFYSAYMARNARDNIGHDAHFYGSVYGVIFCILAYPPVWNSFIVQISRWAGFL